MPRWDKGGGGGVEELVGAMESVVPPVRALAGSSTEARIAGAEVKRLKSRLARSRQDESHLITARKTSF